MSIVGSIKEDMKIAQDTLANLEQTLAIITGDRRPREETGGERPDCLEADMSYLTDIMLRSLDCAKQIREKFIEREPVAVEEPRSWR